MAAAVRRSARSSSSRGINSLGFWITETAVELEHLGARLGEHQPNVQETAILNPVSSQFGEHRRDDRVHGFADEAGGDIGYRGVAAHAPVLGPWSPSQEALVVACRFQGECPFPVTDREHRHLLTCEMLFDHHRPSGVSKVAVEAEASPGLWRRSGPP